MLTDNINIVAITQADTLCMWSNLYLYILRHAYAYNIYTYCLLLDNPIVIGCRAMKDSIC